MTIFNNPGYNAFDNRATIPTVQFSIVLCYVIHKNTIYVGNWLLIWEINTVDEAGNGGLKTKLKNQRFKGTKFLSFIKEFTVQSLKN